MTLILNIFWYIEHLRKCKGKVSLAATEENTYLDS
jgi:hypothetical protein